MKHKMLLLALLAQSALVNSAPAQGTAFTYQGRLNSGGAPANGNYDLAFTLFATNAAGSAIAAPVTNLAVAVSNGLFTTTVDFGSVFAGASNWLQIAVSSNGANNFLTLTPRQQLTPVPYAITAANISGAVNASQLTGTVPAASLDANGGGLTNLQAGAVIASGSPANLGPIIFSTHSVNTIVVPAAVTNMMVKLWGAGGQSYTNPADAGGGGAFVSTSLAVAPGQVFVVVVGASGDNGGGGGSGDAPGGGGIVGGGAGGQASSLFLYANSTYIMKAAAGGGGGGGNYGGGGAGGNPGQGTAGGHDGIGGGNGMTGGGVGFNYAAGATTTGLASLSLMGGGGGGSAVVYAGGGGGGYGGGGGAGYNTGSSSASGGGSYGTTIIGGSGAVAGNTGDPNYQSPNGNSDQDGLAVVIFGGPTVPFSNFISAPGFAGDGSALTNLQASALTGSATLVNLTLTGKLNLPFNNANTALGNVALFVNASGYGNTAVGDSALYFETNGLNTAVGAGALTFNVGGIQNSAFGFVALEHATNGNSNTSIGNGTLYNLTKGDYNIALGNIAGINIIAGTNNITVGNAGAANDNGVIRIGTQGTQTSAFIAGISGVTSSGGAAVYVNSSGQLGTLTSSRRFKTDIQDMGQASEEILSLRPVTFRYKPEIDPQGATQFGLIAEEVNEVNTNLVVRDAQGQIYTVRYEAVNAMLLNEFLKQHQTVETQKKEIGDLQIRLTELEQRVKAIAPGK